MQIVECATARTRHLYAGVSARGSERDIAGRALLGRECLSRVESKCSQVRVGDRTYSRIILEWGYCRNGWDGVSTLGTEGVI